MTNSDEADFDSSTQVNFNGPDPEVVAEDEELIPEHVPSRSARRKLSKLQRLQFDLAEANRLADQKAARDRKKRKQVKKSRRANRK